MSHAILTNNASILGCNIINHSYFLNSEIFLMVNKPTYEELERRIQQLEKAEYKLKQVEAGSKLTKPACFSLL